MPQDQTSASSVPINPNKQEDAFIQKPKDSQNTIAFPSAFGPVFSSASSPMQWPAFPWYPVQGQWGTGLGQGWAQHGPYAGESSHVFGPQPRRDPSPNKNEADPSQGSNWGDSNQGNGSTQCQGFGSIPSEGPNPYHFLDLAMYHTCFPPPATADLKPATLSSLHQQMDHI